MTESTKESSDGTYNFEEDKFDHKYFKTKITENHQTESEKERKVKNYKKKEAVRIKKRPEDMTPVELEREALRKETEEISNQDKNLSKFR